MQQLVLDIRPARQSTLAGFITGQNAELLAHLHALLAGRASERSLYIWGAAGCGKSTLLAAWANACLDAGWRVGESPDADAVVLDAAETWDAQRQLDLFACYNAARERGACFIAAGNAPPARLALLPDLRTRLGWGMVFQLQPLADADKRLAVMNRARALGVTLEPALADYLLTHASRDIRQLMDIVEELERLSLATRRPLTLPLLKTLLAQGD